MTNYTSNTTKLIRSKILHLGHPNGFRLIQIENPRTEHSLPVLIQVIAASQAIAEEVMQHLTIIETQKPFRTCLSLFIWLVVFRHPSEKYEFVSGDD